VSTNRDVNGHLQGTLELLLNDPSAPGTFLTPQTLTFLGGLQVPVAAADFDGDRRTDLLGITRDFTQGFPIIDRLELFLADGQGGYSASVSTVVGSVLDIGPIDPVTGDRGPSFPADISTLVVGDFTGHGKRDVAFLSSGYTDVGD